MPANALSNEATDVDLAAYEALAALGWKRGDTLLYQQTYALTEEAMEKGILYDHLLDPEAYAKGERKRIELSEKQKIELERLNKRVLSEEQAQRWAEIIREKTEYGEKVILFAASQAHCLMLVRALNKVFNDPGEGSGNGGGGGGGGTVLDGILDNPDPKHLIQRVLVMDGKMKLVDNLPIEKARQLFEEGVLSTNNPVIVALRSKIKENADYEPSEEQVDAIRQWAASSEIILNEEQLQRIYDYPAGSIWDFIAAILGGHRIPTARDRIERGFDSYLQTYNFTTEQQKALQRIKDSLAAEAGHDLHRMGENTRRWAAEHPHTGPRVKDAAEPRVWMARQDPPILREEVPAFGAKQERLAENEGLIVPI